MQPNQILPLSFFVFEAWPRIISVNFKKEVVLEGKDIATRTEATSPRSYLSKNIKRGKKSRKKMNPNLVF
jgi:hypothetical protein